MGGGDELDEEMDEVAERTGERPSGGQAIRGGRSSLSSLATRTSSLGGGAEQRWRAALDS